MWKLADNKWVILVVSYLVVVGLSLPYYGWTPALLSVSEDLGLDYTQAGALSSVTALAGGIALLLGGAVVVRTGPKNVILVALVIGIAGQVLFASADSYPVAMLARAISGVAVGLMMVAPFTMAISWFIESRQAGRATGVMVSSDGAGFLLGLVLFGAVLTAVGWRSGLLWQAGYLAVLFVLALVFLRDPVVAQPEQATPEADERRTGATGVVLRALRSRNVLLGMAFYVGVWGLFSLIAAWMPTVLVEGAGWSESLAGLFASLPAVFGVITAVAAGLMSDRFVAKRWTYILVAGLATTAAVVLLAVGISVGNYTLAAVALPLVGLAGYGGMPLVLARSNESVAPEHVAASNGLVLGSGFLIGGIVYPFVLGGVRDATGGFGAGFVAIAIASFVLCVAVQLLGRGERQQAPSAPSDGAVITG
ncbi:MFS transporter [Pseudonocardia endophytica]|uniref:Sugar phosphate permease n=1 Tax=Pseudonocardia endophytica TaxID=401976 RepID=A0A4R1HLF6_PSEEN|nr:MFS transporter [Pseudonocardia endophytica]TCK21931.1 sugar phosphate permease [Pseudonocardia endophytica]